MTAYTNIGRSVPRLDAEEKVTGVARYTADIDLPQTLWGAALRSPLPHARIVNIDVSRALAAPGVHAVLTGDDVRGIRYGRRLYDVPILAEDKVRFIGERVAAVAAVDRDAAEEALLLIDVEYEELPAVSSRWKPWPPMPRSFIPTSIAMLACPPSWNRPPTHLSAKPGEGATSSLDSNRPT